MMQKLLSNLFLLQCIINIKSMDIHCIIMCFSQGDVVDREAIGDKLI